MAAVRTIAAIEGALQPVARLCAGRGGSLEDTFHDVIDNPSR
jgi:hypothetical protein